MRACWPPRPAEGVGGLYNRYSGITSPGLNPLRYGLNQLAPTWGDTAYDGANLLFSLGALRAEVPLKIGIADGLNRPGSMFGVTVPRVNNSTLIPLVNQPLPHGTTQGILLYGVGSKHVVIQKCRHLRHRAISEWFPRRYELS
jgi:filamentous hemagglutinin